jgi:hypothetical protein
VDVAAQISVLNENSSDTKITNEVMREYFMLNTNVLGKMSGFQVLRAEAINNKTPNTNEIISPVLRYNSTQHQENRRRQCHTCVIECDGKQQKKKCSEM